MSRRDRALRQPSGLPQSFLLPTLARGLRVAVIGAALLASWAANARADIVIAAVGSSEPPGNPAAAVRSGIELAMTQLLASASIDGKPVRVISAEDQCNAAGAEAAARSLVAEGVNIVVGHVCSSAAMAAARIYAEARVIFISPGARSSKFTSERAGPTVFRLAGRSDRQASEIGAAIMARYQGKQAAIVNDTGPQSRDLADAVHRVLTSAGFPVVHRESYAPGEKELTELVRRLKIAGSDVVFMPAQPHDLAIILAQMRAQQLDAHVVGSDLLAVPAVIPAADLAGEALKVMLPWVPKPTGAAMERVRPLVQLERDARAVALQSYAATEILIQALKEGGSDPAKVAGTLAGKEFDTVIGRIRFSERGDASIPSYALHVWRDGAWQQID